MTTEDKISKALLDQIIQNGIDKYKADLIEKIETMELATDKKTMEKVLLLNSNSEAFGYCQVWMMKKIIKIIQEK